MKDETFSPTVAEPVCRYAGVSMMVKWSEFPMCGGKAALYAFLMFV